jgi:hypothetical protein
MISVILYGRNDSYGYNLHKRAALGINCMAEVLSGRDDEILFVDYNTPDDHPTFPEAIADTLTDKAVRRLRIFRVRPALHDRVRSRTHLKAIEPIARNVALRRSNPSNRWILSTNTDMIFVPRGPESLTDIAATLADGYYHLPRFELPESLWEGLDRRAPVAVIDQVRRFGRTMYLNEIVYGAECIKYDAPGDFQLMLRSDLFRIDAFNEDMLLGWHVDSNIAKRLHLIYRRVGDVVDRLFGYHCDHTRQVTPMHQHKAASNDAATFIDHVAESCVAKQSATWGFPDDQIEEISLRQSAHHVYMQGVTGVIDGEWAEPVEAYYTPESYGQTSYEPRHVLPFLMDLFASAPRGINVAWVGGRPDSFRLFCEAWRRFGFLGEILVPAWSVPLLPDAAGVRAVDRAGLDSLANVVIFDFGVPSTAPGLTSPLNADPAKIDWAAALLNRESFHHFIADERARLNAGGIPRQVVCVDAIHNPNESMAREEINAPSTPFASRLRHGYVIPKLVDEATVAGPSNPVSLLDSVHVGDSGRRTRRGILARLGHRGYLLTGPDVRLPAGDYRVEFSFQPQTPFSAVALLRPIVIEVVAGHECLIQQEVSSLFWSTVRLDFTISEKCALTGGLTEVRLVHGRTVDFVITDIRLTQVAPLLPPESDSSRLLTLANSFTKADGPPDASSRLRPRAIASETA